MKNDNFGVFLTLKWSKIYENNIRSELEVVFLWFLTIWENIRSCFFVVSNHLGKHKIVFEN